MKTYFEIKVPIDGNADWMKEIKQSLSDIDVHWQNGFYHITAAFISNTVEYSKVVSIIDKHLVKQQSIFSISLDNIDAFTIKDGHIHIIHLASSYIPSGLSIWIDNLRSDLLANSIDIEPDFKLHVTLARVPTSGIGLEELRRRITMPDSVLINFKTTCFEYREFRGDSIKKWDFS